MRRAAGATLAAWRWARAPASSTCAASALRRSLDTVLVRLARLGLEVWAPGARHGVTVWSRGGTADIYARVRPMIEFALVLRDGTRIVGRLGNRAGGLRRRHAPGPANLRQEWRPGVVAHLAALTCVLPRYAGALTTADAWQGALDQLLPGAAPGQWCFHPDGTDRKRCSLADAGPGFLGQGHTVKPAWQATPEVWALASMGGLHRPLTGGGKVQPVARRRLRAYRRRQPGQRGPGPGAVPGTLRSLPAGTLPTISPAGWRRWPTWPRSPYPACGTSVRSGRRDDGRALEQVRLPRTVAEGLLPVLPHAAWRNDARRTTTLVDALRRPGRQQTTRLDLVTAHPLGPAGGQGGSCTGQARPAGPPAALHR